ncbi:substrate-binding domain-containing protein [Plasticicumulans sp.]|uniref:substrate-binding domain-containing protein n=1 Tax=Plasticicumulans sp. TaxID=2307179 RepID=UPI00394E340C
MSFRPSLPGLRAGLCALLLSALSLPVQAAERFITVASTTSTEQSGLFGYLLPKFTGKTGIEVRVVAVGTGQAIKIAQQGDADVLFVHHQPSEEKFVAEGYGVQRFPVMYNDFIVVGPGTDPAGIEGGHDVVAAFRAIAGKQAPFASRGDDSGTHKAEQALWKAAGIDVKAASGSWYRETGSGMGPTLNTAAGLPAYALTDRGTWLSFRNRGPLKIVVEGDKRLFNQYGILLVSPAKFPHVKQADAQAFIDWVISPEGQQAIAGYRINGEQLFFPDYGR